MVQCKSSCSVIFSDFLTGVIAHAQVRHLSIFKYLLKSVVLYKIFKMYFVQMWL